MTSSKNNPTENTADREIVITRVFDAPRELVWQAMTDPQRVVKWWGPRGFTTTIEEMNVKPGGVWKHVMHGPDGTDYPNKSIFTEVEPPERIIYVHSGAKKGGPGAHFVATWTFDALDDGKTRLTMRSVFPSAEDRDKIVKEYGAIEGGKQTLERLGEQLAKAPVVIERTFEAPVEMVWKALTEVDQMKQWSFGIDEFRPELGFEFQFDAEKDGVKYVHRCKVAEVIPQQKLAYTWRYEGLEGNSLVTIELVADGDKTRIKLTHEGLETFLPESNPDFARGNFFKGWTAIIGSSLKEFVEKAASSADRPFVISRVFDAPRELVWKAFTDPEHMKRWWGPKGFTVRVAKMDLRPGGTYHYCMQSPDGHDMWGKFVYREIVAPERIVFINSFSDEKGGLTRHPMSPTWPLEMLSTFTFAEHEGKTTLTIRWIPLNAKEAERKTFDDGHASMQQGWTGTLDQLANYLAKA